MIQYHMMEYMGRMVRKTGAAVVIALLMLVLMGQAQSRRNMAAAYMGAAGADPWSEEFSLSRDGAAVGLGVQDGAFPWGAKVTVKQSAYWRNGGRGFFEITGDDGSVFRGVRKEGTADALNGVLLEMYTENPDWRTRRGAAVGMSLEDTLSLYPEAQAEYDAHREPGSYRYTYASARGANGSSLISFVFRNNALASIDVSHTGN